MEKNNEQEFLRHKVLKIGYTATVNLIPECVNNLLSKSSKSLADTLDQCPRSGFLIELMATFLEILKFDLRNVTLIQVNHTNFFSSVNGTFGGLVGDVANGLFDTVIPYVSITNERMEAVDFGGAMVTTSLGFLTMSV